MRREARDGRPDIRYPGVQLLPDACFGVRPTEAALHLHNACETATVSDTALLSFALVDWYMQLAPSNWLPTSRGQAQETSSVSQVYVMIDAGYSHPSPPFLAKRPPSYCSLL